MNIGHFYFLEDSYFADFPDPYLMSNKGAMHDRPCFYAFLDSNTSLFWMIPFSSKVVKFQAEYSKKIERYGRCDTIVFGSLLGRQKAFLIQNMCPITSKYIKNEYIDPVSNIPVKVDGVLQQTLIQKASRVLKLQRQGNRLIFPDVLKIEQRLLEELNNGNE